MAGTTFGIPEILPGDGSGETLLPITSANGPGLSYVDRSRGWVETTRNNNGTQNPFGTRDHDNDPYNFTDSQSSQSSTTSTSSENYAAQDQNKPFVKIKINTNKTNIQDLSEDVNHGHPINDWESQVGSVASTFELLSDPILHNSSNFSDANLVRGLSAALKTNNLLPFENIYMELETDQPTRPDEGRSQTSESRTSQTFPPRADSDRWCPGPIHYDSDDEDDPMEIMNNDDNNEFCSAIVITSDSTISI